jgi:hypothetical protein
VDRQWKWWGLLWAGQRGTRLPIIGLQQQVQLVGQAVPVASEQMLQQSLVRVDWRRLGHLLGDWELGYRLRRRGLLDGLGLLLLLKRLQQKGKHVLLAKMDLMGSGLVSGNHRGKTRWPTRWLVLVLRLLLLLCECLLKERHPLRVCGWLVVIVIRLHVGTAPSRPQGQTFVRPPSFREGVAERDAVDLRCGR